MNTIETVRHFELGNPLVVVVISALDSYFGYPGDFQKGYLNPLRGITYFSTPSSNCATTAGSVEAGVGRSVATVPLESNNHQFTNQKTNQLITGKLWCCLQSRYGLRK